VGFKKPFSSCDSFVACWGILSPNRHKGKGGGVFFRVGHLFPFVLPFLGWFFLGWGFKRAIRIYRFIFHGRASGLRVYRRYRR